MNNSKVGIGREENLGHHKNPYLFRLHFHDENLKPIKMYILFVRAEQRKNSLSNFYI